MGNQYNVDSPWSAAASWESVKEAGDDSGPPGVGDDVIFDADTVNCTLDENSAALGSLNMTGYTSTLAMGNNDIPVSGTATLGGTITAGTGKLTCKVLAGSGTAACAVTIQDPTAAWWSFTGTLTGAVIVDVTTDVGPGGAIDVDDTVTFIGDTADRAMTMDAALLMGPTKDLVIRNVTTDKTVNLIMGAHRLTCRDVLLGSSAGGDDLSGSIDFGVASHSIRSLSNQHADNDFCAVDFGSAHIEVSGTVDGAEAIIPTCTDGACHIMGGTVQNWADPGGAVHCHDTTDGGGTTNFTFSTHAHPGSLMSMGVGI